MCVTRNGSSSSSGQGFDDSSGTRRFESQLKSCEMRFAILKNEEDEYKGELISLQRKRKQLNSGGFCMD